MRKYAIIGGDLRNVKLGEELIKDKNEVRIIGFEKKLSDTDFFNNGDLEKTLEGSDIIIAPLVFSNDEETINTPFYNQKIYISDLLRNIKKGQILVVGKISQKIEEQIKSHNIFYINILEREEMSVLNAIPTAEGAIQIAMEQIDITLHDSNCMILGFGRIGKVLSKMLDGIGADVYVEARKKSDLAWIEAYGYTGIELEKIGEKTREMDVIFNTIPCRVIDYNILKNIKKESVIIDLASNPGGVDFEVAKKLNINIQRALSLPGKVAPKTSAKFIKRTIYNIISELERGDIKLC